MRHQQLHDLIPEGFLSLCSAYECFVAKLWRGHEPIEELSDPALYRDAHPEIAWGCRLAASKVIDRLREEFLKPFITGSLDAFVRPSGSADNHIIPADSWRTAFPERVFLAEVIKGDHGGYWTALKGRTPFVRRDQFETWLAQQIERVSDPDATPSPANRELREVLFGLAKLGVMKSAEVERRAERWGWPPLASKPAADRHNPSRLSHWTLCMAASWIAWRTLEDVRLSMDEYRAEYWTWCGYSHRVAPNEGRDLNEWHQVTGEALETLDPLSLTSLGISEACGIKERDSPLLMSIKGAREELWQRLGEGALVATGLNADGNVVAIPAHEWSRLQLAASLDISDKLVFEHWKIKTAYSGVSMQRSAVMDLWRASPPGSAKPPDETVTPLIEPVNRGKVHATRLAIAALFAGGVPIGLTAKERLERINYWHRNAGNSEVSQTTIRRALKNK